jgi:hypothetical protein
VAAAVLIGTLVAAPARVGAQSGLETALEQYNAATIKGYVGPLADVLVANLAGGYHNGARIPLIGLTWSIEFVGSLAKIEDDLRTYTAQTPQGFQPATYQTPTIFGGTAPVVNHSSQPGISYRGADGLVSGDYFPGGVPQLRLGGILGTEVVVRWVSSSLFPVFDEEDFPELTLFGVGVRHNIGRYFTALPLDISVGGSLNSLTFGDIVDLKGTSFGIQVGKSVSVLGVYGGISSDGGSMNLKYESTDPTAGGNVDVDLDAERGFRFTVGAALNVPVLKVFGDATFGSVSTYSFGLRIGS